MIVAFTMTEQKTTNPIDRLLISFFKKTGDVQKYVHTVYNVLRYVRFGEKRGVPEQILNMNQEYLLTSDILNNSCITVSNIIDICLGDYVRVGQDFGVIIAIDDTRMYIVDQFAQTPSDYLHAIALDKALDNFTLIRPSKIHDFAEGSVEI